MTIVSHKFKSFVTMLLSVVSVGLCSQALNASPIIVSDNTISMDLTEGVTYLNDEGGILKNTDLLRSNEFTATPSKIRPLSLGPDAYATTWSRFEIKNIGPKTCFFYLSYPDKLASLIEVYDDGGSLTVEPPQVGGRQARARTSVPTYFPSFALDIPVGGTRTILTRVSSKQTSLTVPRITNPYGFSHENNLTMMVLGIRIGAAIAVLLGLIIFFQLKPRRRFYAYCAYVISVVIFLFARETTTHQYLAPAMAAWIESGFAVSILLCLITRSYCYCQILQTKTFSKQGDRVLVITMILTSLTALLSVVDPNRNLWILVSLLVALNVLTSSVISYKSYRRGLKTALYVCLGGIAFGILIGLTGASEYGLLPPSKYLIMAPFFGVTLEMISFGLGHAYESRKLHASIELERQMSTESEAQLKVNHALILEREKSVEFNHSIISNLPVPLILIGNDLRVIRVNQCFIENFKFDHNELQNLIFGSELAPERGGKWNRKELSVFLSDIKEGRGSASTFLFQGEISGRREVYQLNAQRIISQQDNLPQILLVVEDLTEVFESNKNIKSEAALVAQASAAKTSFLANMSHEIRTPLAVIMGYAEILKKDVDSFGKNNSHISKIIKSSEHLLALVDEVLDISKIESGMVAIYPVEIDLLSELKDTFGILTERAKLKGLTLEVEFVGPLPDTVTTCPLRLRQILINVIGNAAKFTDSGGVKIRVSLPDSQKLCFEVEDTGCGLTLVQQKALFQPFVQADSSTSRRYGGSGLGLALSRQLARVMGGDIELRWSEVDKGTCFLITIDPGKISGVRHVDHAKWLSAVEPFPVSTPPVRQLPNLQLLLVEDTPELRYLLKLFLEATGAKVDVAENGEEGVKLCLAKEYDLVFMDIQMPVLDGYQAAAKLLELGYRAPIIALTAHAIKTEQEKCLASGFADYISKPVNSQDLVAMVIKHTFAVPTA